MMGPLKTRKCTARIGPCTSRFYSPCNHAFLLLSPTRYPLLPPPVITTQNQPAHTESNTNGAQLWSSIGPKCLASSGALEGSPSSPSSANVGLSRWALAGGNPGHNRYAKMLSNNTDSPVLRKEHNCIIGNEADSLKVWARRRRRGARTLLHGEEEDAELWGALNDDTALLDEALGVLRHRFWFVGILEELETSLAVFCGLSRSCSKLSPVKKSSHGMPSRRGRSKDRRRKGARRMLHGEALLEEDRPYQEHEVQNDEGVFEVKGAKHKHLRRKILQKHSSKPGGFKLSPELRKEISARNTLDLAIYQHAREQLKITARDVLWQAL